MKKLCLALKQACKSALNEEPLMNKMANSLLRVVLWHPRPGAYLHIKEGILKLGVGGKQGPPG